MKYYIKEFQESEEARTTAGGKAREDVDDILENAGYACIEYADKLLESDSVAEALKNHKVKSKVLESLLEGLTSGDELVVQFPIVNNSIYHAGVFKKLKKRGVKVVLIVHDLESLRYLKNSSLPVKKKIRFYIEEKGILKTVDKIIVHNERMVEAMKSLGYDERKMVPLGIFDYLIPEYDNRKRDVDSNIGFGKPVIVAGNLRREKVGYVYQLPENVEFNLYGIGYEEQDAPNIKYHGAFPPEDLPFEVQGSFGLVWDGSSADTCAGVYGEYLKINNPHKTSLYIAAGIPVIIWDQAALAGFVKDNNCGITVSSLGELQEKMSRLTEEEYGQMTANAQRLGEKLRMGSFTVKALDK